MGKLVLFSVTLLLIGHFTLGQIAQGHLRDDRYTINFNDTPGNFLDKNYEEFLSEEEFEMLRQQGYISVRFGIDILTQKIVVVEIDSTNIKEYSKLLISASLIEKLEKIISENIKIEWIANPSHDAKRVAYRIFFIGIDEKRKYKIKRRKR
ncbi:MAG: hypothetical protein ACFB0B_17485 [Thermonemataceae bacterium]